MTSRVRWVFRAPATDGTTVQAAAGLPAAAPSLRAEILDGLKATLPFMVGAAPVGIIFGALATAQGLSIFETMALSLFVFSGSAQFVAISLMTVATPAWVIWGVTFILNLRHTLYAATLVRYVPAGGQAIWMGDAVADLLVEITKAARIGTLLQPIGHRARVGLVHAVGGTGYVEGVLVQSCEFRCDGRERLIAGGKSGGE